jgi:hypothetical protein
MTLNSYMVHKIDVDKTNLHLKLKTLSYITLFFHWFVFQNEQLAQYYYDKVVQRKSKDTHCLSSIRSDGP